MKIEGTGRYLRGTGTLCKPSGYSREGRKDGDGETAPRATSQALGTGHWARLNCWPGLLRETKGGEDTKKLRGRQQGTGRMPVTKSELPLSKAATGEPGGSSWLWRLGTTTSGMRRSARRDEASLWPGGGWPVSELTVPWTLLLMFLGLGAEAERGWHGGPGPAIKGNAYASFLTDARRQGFRFSLKLLRLGKAVLRELLSKHLMNLLQKEKNLFSHLHLQTPIIK